MDKLIDRTFWMRILVIFLIVAVGSSAWAKRKKGKRTTSINFEDELIEGDVKKPELLYLLQKKQFNFRRLINLRDDFLPEMRQTAEDLHVDRSGD